MRFTEMGCLEHFRAVAAVTVCLIVGSGCQNKAFAFPPRPHIVILLADDLGWNDVSFHGSDQIPTPNLDALAYNGVILNHHYVQPVCTPSRAALMTGRYPIHMGMQGAPIRPPDPDGVPLQFRLLPEYLRELGYRTHAVGKWHLGYYRRPYLPQQRGFETYFGVYNGYSGYYDYMAQNINENKVYTGFDLHRNETPAWDLVGRYSTDLFSSEAVRLIKSHNPQEPMFLYMAYTAVHSTNQGRFLEAPQARINSFKYIIDPNRRVFAAMVSKLDDSVGEIVEALKDNQMLDNSIILFMSDNGAPSERQAIYPNWGSNFPFRGAKETLWEGGTRSPSFIWAKEFQANPRVSNELFHITDWLPTLVSAAGGDRFRLPSDLDGHDQWYALRWNLPSARKEALLNINEKERTAGIVTRYDTINLSRRTWKLVVGTASEGKFDGIYNDVRSPLNPIFDFKKVINSVAYRSLTTLYELPVKETQMRFFRRAATIQCNDNSIVDDSRAPNCNAHPCLFNLDIDPCEKFDLAPNNTGIVQQLYGQLKFFRRTLVPQPNRVPDYPAADPRRFNNTWATWVY